MSKQVLLGSLVGTALAAGLAGGYVLYERDAVMTAVEAKLDAMRAQNPTGSRLNWSGMERGFASLTLSQVSFTSGRSLPPITTESLTISPGDHGTIDVVARNISQARKDTSLAPLRVSYLTLKGMRPPAGGEQGLEGVLTVLGQAALEARDISLEVGHGDKKRQASVRSISVQMNAGDIQAGSLEGLTLKQPLLGAYGSGVQRATLRNFSIRDVAALVAWGEKAKLGTVEAVPPMHLDIALEGLDLEAVHLASASLLVQDDTSTKLEIQGLRHRDPSSLKPLLGTTIPTLTRLTLKSHSEGEASHSDLQAIIQDFGNLHINSEARVLNSGSSGVPEIRFVRASLSLQDNGLRRILSNTLPEHHWPHLFDGLSKSLGEMGVEDQSDIEARLADFLGKGSPLSLSLSAKEQEGLPLGRSFIDLPPSSTPRLVLKTHPLP